MLRYIALAAVALAALTACGTTTKTVIGPTTTVSVKVNATTTATTTVAPPGGQVTESCGPIIQGSDGDIGNTVCPDGHANAAAVDNLRDDGFLTIDLDPSATSQQVAAALCAEKGLTNPIRETLYKTAAALNGWNFATDVLDADGDMAGPCSH